MSTRASSSFSALATLAIRSHPLWPGANTRLGRHPCKSQSHPGSEVGTLETGHKAQVRHVRLKSSHCWSAGSSSACQCVDGATREYALDLAARFGPSKSPFGKASEECSVVQRVAVTLCASRSCFTCFCQGASAHRCIALVSLSTRLSSPKAFKSTCSVITFSRCRSCC